MSTVFLIIRLIIALAFVGGLLAFMARSAKKGRFASFLGGVGERNDLEITSQRPLGRTTSVAIVRAGGRHLLIGVSDHGVQLLAEGDDLVQRTDRADKTGRSTDVDLTATDAGPTKWQAASKHLPAALSPTQPRMTLIESLRELTVRKS
jgi:flagellar protein FliO/FliZ